MRGESDENTEDKRDPLGKEGKNNTEMNSDAEENERQKHGEVGLCLHVVVLGNANI